MPSSSRPVKVLQFGVLAAVTAVIVACSACSATPPGAIPSVVTSGQGPSANPIGTSSHKVLAHAWISASTGGSLSARHVGLTVPAHALVKNGIATIAQGSPGIYDISVNARLAGQVAVTVPLSGPNDLVVHYVDGGWRVESAGFGQQTVWVTHLSPFSSLSNLAKKAVCLKSKNPKAIVRCLIIKGITAVSAKFLSWLAKEGGLGDACIQRIIGSGGGLSALYHALSGACVGHAGDSGYTYPPTISGSTGNPPAANSSGGTGSNSDSAPSGGSGAGNPSPAANAAVSIGWSSAHPGWITITLHSIPVGTYTYSCDFSSGGDASFSLTETSEPQTFDNGHTCYDTIGGDTVWVTIGSVRSNTLTVAAPAPPSPHTYAETVGGVTHTWTNYNNAGGTEGPSIAAFRTVQVTCKRTGFKVADGDTWWYRIASSPWNGSYYASADAFYNNGRTSGSLIGTPFYDPKVPNC